MFNKSIRFHRYDVPLTDRLIYNIRSSILRRIPSGVNNSWNLMRIFAGIIFTVEFARNLIAENTLESCTI